jgi:hypothetical protein
MSFTAQQAANATEKALRTVGHADYLSTAPVGDPAADVDNCPEFRQRSLHEWEMNRVPRAEYPAYVAEIGREVAARMEGGR